MIGSSNHVHAYRSDWFESELLLLVKVIFLASSKRGENQFFGNNFRNEVFPERHMGGPRSYMRSGHFEAIWSSLAPLLAKLANCPARKVFWVRGKLVHEL